MPEQGKRVGALVGFSTVVGLAGWSFLLAAATGQLGPAAVTVPDGLAIALFAAVILAGRSSAVRTEHGQVLALDGAFYIAAAVCLGSVLAGAMVAAALTLDAAARLLATPAARRDLGRWAALSYILFFGGGTGAMVTLIGWLFGLDALYTMIERTDLSVLVGLLIAGATFVVLHYGLQGIRVRLAGGSMAEHLRDHALPGAAAEAALMPLAAIIVYVYEPDQPLRFVLLGVTYVVINLAFNRIRSTSASLGRRVADLEVLNATARALADSLHTGDVFEAAARAATRALPAASAVTLARQGDDGAWSVERYVPTEGSITRDPGEWPVPGVEAILESGEAVLSVDGDGAWLGVPLAFYGHIEGVLCVESTEPGAFAADDCRLLQSIAAQTTVAIQNADLYALAMVDGLTRLYVRRYFDARLEEEIRRSQRFDTSFSVIMMDIDNFKSLNDRYGHLVGDRVLQAVADVVRSELRGVDTAARYGGEELAMILPRTQMIEAYNVAERIRAGIEALEVRGDARPVAVTASFGIASYPESGAGSREDLVRRADRALYRAKRTGKNRVELYWDDPEEPPVALKLVEGAEE
jgi:diguanylate cyclase (GGDEF)-like protein